MLTAAASIRAAAGILGEAEDLGADWRRRFVRNLGEDAERLATGAGALSVAVETARRDAPQGPADLAAWVEAHPDLAARVEAGAPPEAPPALRPQAEALCAAIARDAAALPFEALERAIGRGGLPDPLRIAAELGLPPALVCRRLGWRPGAGLVTCDASGAPLLRRAPPGFALPRAGAPCPLLPLYEALGAPARPVRRLVEMPGAGRFDCVAVAEPAPPAAWDAPPRVEAAMLVRPSPGYDGAGAVPAGPGCRVCPRSACPARREPAIFAATAGAAPL